MMFFKRLFLICKTLRKDPDISFNKPIRRRFPEDEAEMFAYAVVSLFSSIITICTLGKYSTDWGMQIILCDYKDSD